MGQVGKAQAFCVRRQKRLQSLVVGDISVLVVNLLPLGTEQGLLGKEGERTDFLASCQGLD